MQVLLEQRFERILSTVNKNHSVTVQELMELCDASESTIRRDLTTLHNNGSLIKVHGGAVCNKTNYNLRDDDIESRQTLHLEEKKKIAKYAAGLIKEEDFVYLDAGTTTECMVPFIESKTTIFVTNSITIAKNLIKRDLKVYLIGGELKPSTEAIVGTEAVSNLLKYNFTKGFFGTNGISKQFGYTTPDVHEAMVKKTAASRCMETYILGDSSKFSQISPVTFAEFLDGTIITTALVDDNYRNCTNILEVNN